MAWVAEVYEPFPVDVLCHLLQYLDAPVVVLFQVIIGRQDGGYILLGREWWEWNRQIAQYPLVQVRYIGAPSVGAHVATEQWGFHEVRIIFGESIWRCESSPYGER